MPRLPSILLLLLVSIVQYAHALEIPKSAEKPNVLFITIDDLNDWVSILDGHPQALTPNFERLAKRGINFTNAHCNVPVCSPSRTSFMTGVAPHNSWVLTNGDRVFDLHGKYLTLPELFTQNGYHVMGAGKLFHGSGNDYRAYFGIYGPGSGNQGGPFTQDELNTQNQNPTNIVNRGPGKLQAVLPMNGMPDVRRTERHRNNSFDWGPVNVSTDEMPDGQVNAWAIEQLKETHDKPFFLGVGYYRPHQPMFVPEKYFEPFPLDSIQLPDVLEEDLDDLSEYAQKLALYPLTSGSHDGVVEYNQWHAAVQGYLASVYFVDTLLGNLLDALDQSKYADNTLIVLFSDHGYHTGEKEHWGKMTGWQESTRVPMIVALPKSCKKSEFTGKRVDAPVSLVDVYPTLVDIINLTPPKHDLDGENLFEVIKNPESRVAITSVARGSYSIRSQDHRYILYFDGTEELYDKKTDPEEWHNLATDPDYQRVKKNLRKHIPADDHVTHYVRAGKWKAVIYNNREAELYEIVPGTGGGGGIGETSSVAENHPGILTKIVDYLDKNPTRTKRVILDIPDLEG